MKFKHNSKMSKFCYEAPAASVATLTGSEIPATVVSVGRCPACTVGDVARVILFTTVLLGTEGTLPGITVACVACTPTAGIEKVGKVEGAGRFIGREKFVGSCVGADGNCVGANVVPVVIGGNGIGGIPGIDIGGNVEKSGIFDKFGNPDGGGIPGPTKGVCAKLGNGAGCPGNPIFG